MALKWNLVGVYQTDTGLFFLREGESQTLHQHFAAMNSNRIQNKKVVT